MATRTKTDATLDLEPFPPIEPQQGSQAGRR